MRTPLPPIRRGAAGLLAVVVCIAFAAPSAHAEEHIDRLGIARWEVPPTWERVGALRRWVLGGVIGQVTGSAAGAPAAGDEKLLDAYTRSGGGLLSPSMMMIVFRETTRPPRRSEIRREAAAIEQSAAAALAAGAATSGPRIVPGSTQVTLSETAPAFTFETLIEEDGERRRVVVHSLFSRLGIHLFVFDIRAALIDPTRAEVAAILASIALQPGMEPPAGLVSEWGMPWAGAFAGCLVGVLVGMREWLARRRRRR